MSLTRKVLDLLLILVREAGRLKTREQLIEALWANTVVEEHGLTSTLYALRKVLGGAGDSARYIETVRGVGYRFIAPVERVETAGKPTPETLGSAATPRHERHWQLVAGVLALAGVVAGAGIWQFTRSASAPPATLPTLAVLPFENLGADQANDYFAAGLQDTILTRLAAIPNIRVISRTSSNTYASHPQNLRKIAQELHATAILEGSVQRTGKQVLINVQLINAATDTHLWADAYQRKSDDILNVESSVARQVASTLLARLTPQQEKLLTQVPTRNPQAYDLFLKANYDANRIFDSSTPDSYAAVHETVALYRQAIALDPRFALAFARLSLLESRAAWFGTDRDLGTRQLAEQDAKQALTLDSQLAQAYLALGYVDYYLHQDFPLALTQFRHAEHFLPHNADVDVAIALVTRRQGKWQQSLRQMQQAMRQDPRNPRWPLELGVTLMTLRHYDEAQKQFDSAMTLGKVNYDALYDKVSLLLLGGKAAQAKLLLAHAPDSFYPGQVPAFRFQAAYIMRDPEQALAALKSSPDHVPSPTGGVGAYSVDLLRAEAWQLKGDQARAHQHYLAARAHSKTLLSHFTNNPDLWSSLGLAEAGLGNAREALHDGQHAMELCPVTHDILRCQVYLADFARINARLNRADAAVQLLDQLLKMPAGLSVSVQSLQTDPAWDNLRNNAGFQALLKKYSDRTEKSTDSTTAV